MLDSSIDPTNQKKIIDALRRWYRMAVPMLEILDVSRNREEGGYWQLYFKRIHPYVYTSGLASDRYAILRLQNR